MEKMDGCECAHACAGTGFSPHEKRENGHAMVELRLCGLAARAEASEV